MQLKQTLIIAAILSVMSIVAWEYYWRSQGFYPTLDDDEALWSVQRNRVQNLSDNDVILTGSSRVLFNIQLNEWEKIIERRPLQLAIAGSSPLPVFHDIVEKTDFKGTVLVGVTPGLFFSTTNPKADPWDAAQSKVNYFHNRTYAQRLNHVLSIPLQQNFAFISDVSGVDGINLKQLIKKIKVGNRVSNPMPPFHEFSDLDIERNTKMTAITVQDTAFANTVKRVWQFFDKEPRPPQRDSTITYFSNDVKKFMNRGGRVILLRNPSTGFYKQLESERLPRTEFWNKLLIQSNAKGYHYNDYEKLRDFDCPEWSHLSAEDAATFTTELAKIIKKDNVLTN